jgi:hypothetical protein
MTKITYEIVEHDGGWAYRVDGPQSGGARSEGTNRSGRHDGHLASRSRCQNKKYLCAIASTSAGAQVSSSPLAVTS